MKNAARDRIDAIRHLVKTHKICDQLTLVTLLKSEFGIAANQTVVSRDLRKLNVVKCNRAGQLVYELPKKDVTEEILQLAIVDIIHNESMIVIKTQPALAAFVGDQIDACSDLPILGCLAGENAVFVTPESMSSIHETYLALCNKMNFKIEE